LGNLPGFLREVFPLLGALILAAGLKAVLLALKVVPFNSDEAVVALMARHILQGARPVFFYGQAYMGSLDAWLVALAFRLVGEGVLAVRLVQAALYLLYLATLWALARRLLGMPRAPALAVWLAAVPPVLVTTYTTLSLGGYGEILVLGNLILLVGYEVVWGRWSGSWAAWLLLGVAGGLAFWTLGMAGVYLLPVAVLGLLKLGFKPWPRYLLGLAGFALGSAPWWWVNFLQRGASLEVLLKSSLPPSTLLTNLTVFCLFGLPSVLGLRPPWSPAYPPLPLLFASLVLYLSMTLYLASASRRRELPAASGVKWLFGLLILGLCALMIFTNYGIDVTGRYYLPLYLPLVLGMAVFIAAAWARRPAWGMALLALALLLNTVETARVAASPAQFTDQFTEITIFDNRHDTALIDFLKQEGELRGYTNYWVSFRIAFLSQEEILYAARLPYKADLYYNPANDRYPPYSAAVEQSQRVAYITTKHPMLDHVIRQRFTELGVDFLETQIGDFHVFYRLSRVVRPEEIGF
jgi:4-amino-4-deoxy-L-arabinose transferase-like glycosyltransferase